jgi:acyl-CoA thioesterase FadM
MPAAEQPACRVFQHVLEVRPSDRDAAGHLNHVATVAFFEHGRVRAHHDVRQAHPELPDMTTAVRSLRVEYHAQAPPFARLTILSWVRRDGRTSRTWAQVLVREDGVVVATAEVTSVLVDPASGRAARLPAVYRDLFASHRQD